LRHVRALGGYRAEGNAGGAVLQRWCWRGGRSPPRQARVSVPDRPAVPNRPEGAVTV